MNKDSQREGGCLDMVRDSQRTERLVRVHRR